MHFAKTILTAAALSTGSSVTANDPATPTTPEAAEITAPGAEGNLAGTLIAPAGGKPVMLLIPGSGPTDRDGNNPLMGRPAPYRMLTEALALRGIGSVRVDKRGMFGSSAAVADANAVTIGDYVDDVAAWTGVIREQTGAECVWLAGHSEGGLVTLASAGEVDNLCGLILISAPGRPLGDVLREQLNANPANAIVLPDALAAITSLEAGERVDISGMHPALRPLFAPRVQGFLIDAFSRDPAALAAATDLPTLIVQGSADLQVKQEDAAALHEAQPASELVTVAGMTHVLKLIEGDDMAANMATYSNADLPIAPGVVDAIADFILADRGAE